MTAGLTFDTGALISLERRRARIAQVYTTAVQNRIPITVPWVVLVEWWRGPSDARDLILRGVRIEAPDLALAKVAGEALAAIPSATTIDAIVMASAARRGDMVYTSDYGDLERLRSRFPSVRVFGV